MMTIEKMNPIQQLKGFFKNDFWKTFFIYTMLFNSFIFLLIFWSAFTSPTGRAIIDVNSLGEGLFEAILFTSLFFLQFWYFIGFLAESSKTLKERLYLGCLFGFIFLLPILFYLYTNG